MSYRINYIVPGKNDVNYALVDVFPDTCPLCDKGISPELCGGFKTQQYTLQAVFRCPRNECANLFISYYGSTTMPDPQYLYKSSQPKRNIFQKAFEKQIEELSPEFVKIFNQASHAEQLGLDEICGMGYRKSLEFLIKDFIKSTNPDKVEEIEKLYLQPVIERFVDDRKIKGMAKRAAWVGNDETHYIRRNTHVDIEDLKKLIEVTKHWILMELFTEDYEELLPD